VSSSIWRSAEAQYSACFPIPDRVEATGQVLMECLSKFHENAGSMISRSPSGLSTCNLRHAPYVSRALRDHATHQLQEVHSYSTRSTQPSTSHLRARFHTPMHRGLLVVQQPFTSLQKHFIKQHAVSGRKFKLTLAASIPEGMQARGNHQRTSGRQRAGCAGAGVRGPRRHQVPQLPRGQAPLPAHTMCGQACTRLSLWAPCPA